MYDFSRFVFHIATPGRELELVCIQRQNSVFLFQLNCNQTLFPCFRCFKFEKPFLCPKGCQLNTFDTVQHFGFLKTPRAFLGGNTPGVLSGASSSDVLILFFFSGTHTDTFSFLVHFSQFHIFLCRSNMSSLHSKG